MTHLVKSILFVETIISINLYLPLLNSLLHLRYSPLTEVKIHQHLNYCSEKKFQKCTSEKLALLGVSESNFFTWNSR